MPFYVDDKPSLSEIAGAINYLLSNFAQVKAINPNSGQITTSSFGVTGYLYKYLNVKYADSFDGSVNFSDSPTNRLYYGLRNNDSSVESTLYSDYVWTPVTGGFGTTKFFYYATSGGRQIQTYIGTTAPAYGWSVDTGAAIDLDLVTFVYQNVNTFSAGTTGFTPSTPTLGDVVLAGTLNVTNGGTGVTTSTGTGSVVLSTNPSLTTPTQVTYENWTPISSPTYAEGKVWYDSTQKSLAYFNDVTNNVLHVGQETQLKVYNNTGSTIARGAPVYITSTSSGFSYPLVALAKADTQITGNAIGLANQSIPNATAGYITISGLVNGLSLGAMTVGDTVYVSPYSAGQLMTTYPPTGYPIKIGVVAYANTPNGAIYVSQSNAYVLANGVVGTLAIANGGTNGTAVPTAYGVAYGTGTTYAFTAAGTTGQVLSATTSGAPVWSSNGAFTSLSYTTTLTGGTGIIAIGTNQFYKDASGNVGIGNTAANVNDQVGSIRPLLVSSSDTVTTIAGSKANIVIGNSDTTTSNTSQLSFAAITGANSTYFTAATINCVFGARTNGQYPTGQLVFSTSTALNAAPTEKFRIDNTGNALVTGAGGLGYGTGSGGTVTQGTSRTTGVTLNKSNGAITMFSAAGSVVAATFTVTNSIVAATDTIVLNQKSGTNLYVLLVTAVAAGSFNITFYTTGGVATDAPVINFAVIKAVTA
jgi:hypothetical protein